MFWRKLSGAARDCRKDDEPRIWAERGRVRGVPDQLPAGEHVHMPAHVAFIVPDPPLHCRMCLRQRVEGVGDGCAVRHVDLDRVGTAGMLA